MLNYLLHKVTQRTHLTRRHHPVDMVTPRTVPMDVGLTLLPEEHQWLCTFNDRLSHVNGNSRILKISSVDHLNELLAYYYGRENPLIPSASAFPYLHGLHNKTQRLFFESYASPHELLTLASFAHYPKKPQIRHHSHFSLMAVDAAKSPVPIIINASYLDDILTPNYDLDDDDGHFEYAEYNHLNMAKASSLEGIDNRNLAGQVKIAASLSHFLVFSNDMDWDRNIKAACALQALAQQDKVVYVVDFAVEAWDKLGAGFVNNTKASHGPELLQWEQNSIWKLNSIKWAYPGICLGTLTDFSYLSRSSKHNFRVYIDCNEKAQFPNPQSLDKAFADIRSSLACNPLYIEFPSSGQVRAGSMTESESLSMLKVLQLVRYFIKVRKQDIFVFCVDGFSGLSMFTVALGLFNLDADASVEDVIMKMLGNKNKTCAGRDDLRLYYYRHDFAFLKQFNPYIQAAKSTPLDPETLIDEIPQPIHISAAPELDWFRTRQDNNFPSKIVDNIYLGSHAQATSITILRSIGITKIVSMGEQPRWFAKLPFKFDFDVRDSDYPVVLPVFQYDGCSVYIINIAQQDRLAEYPELETIVYVHNLHDDGRDSLWPLLVGPEEVQSAVFGPQADCPSTLVHCRIGVSRSASVVIARLMKYNRMSFISAYMFVRVRRLNIIIQPNLRFLYELFLYEEHLNLPRGDCWWTLCHEIDKLNRHYIR